MSVAHTPEPTDLVPSTRARRNPTELPQATFRTALRGFDRDEVRTLLEEVAADYRVLQMRNASLQRQLASLEAVLVSYLREEGPIRGAVPSAPVQGDQSLQRANTEAQAVLARAHAQAEEIVAAARARVRNLEQLEQEQKRFRSVVGATISDLLTVLNVTRSDQKKDADPHQRLARELLAKQMLLDAPVTRPAITGEVARPQPQPPAAPASAKSAPPVRNDANQTRGKESASTGRGQADTPPATRTSLALTEPYTGHKKVAAAQPPSESLDSVERIKSMLKSIDVALVEIPVLPSE